MLNVISPEKIPFTPETSPEKIPFTPAISPEKVPPVAINAKKSSIDIINLSPVTTI